MSKRTSPPSRVVRWRAAVRDHAGISWRAKYAAMVLSTYMGSDGRHGWPGVERLAREMGISSRSVQRGLRELEEVELVRVVKRPGRTTEYDALVPETGGDCESPPGEGVTVSHPTLTDSHPGVTVGRGTGDCESPEVGFEVVHEIAQEVVTASGVKKEQGPDPRVVDHLKDFLKSMDGKAA